MDSLDVGQQGEGQPSVTGAEALTFLSGGKIDPIATTRRYFGRGDTLRNATLEFNSGSVVVIESQFENCSITLGEGTELTVGAPGRLHGCKVRGPGNIIVEGGIFEHEAPTIAGAARLILRDGGAISGTVEQHPNKTVFAIERGSKLRVSITQPK